MATSTLRPSSTVANGSLANLTGATIHGATSDDDDGTYVEPALLSYIEVALSDFSQPAGSVIKSAVLRARLKANVSAYTTWTVLGHPTPYIVSLSNPTTVTIATITAPSDSDVDAATVRATIDAGSTALIYEIYLDVVYVDVPVVSADSPTGTIATNLPTIEWSDTLDADGGAQTRYEVKVYTDAQYGAGGFDPDTSTPTAESGEVSGADTSWAPDTALVDDTYRAYVRVAQTVNGSLFWSDWDYTQFTTSAPKPANPTLALTPDNTDALIEVTATDPGGGAATTQRFQIQRSDDGGTTWVDVRTDLGGGLIDKSGSSGSVDDYEAPNGVTVDYRVRAIHTATGAVSDWVTDDAMWVYSGAWVKSASDPSLNLACNIKTQPGHSRPARQSIEEPLERPDPVVISGGRGAKRGEIGFILLDEDEIDAFEALLDLEEPLLIQTPTWQKWPDRWVMLGDLEAGRFVDKAWSIEGLRTHSWIEVAAP